MKTRAPRRSAPSAHRRVVSLSARGVRVAIIAAAAGSSLDRAAHNGRPALWTLRGARAIDYYIDPGPVNPLISPRQTFAGPLN